MPVPSSLADLSTTAASNSPAGSDAIGTSLDDYLRTTQALLKQALSKGTDIASSASITIPTNGNYCVVTGTTTISGIADSWNGRAVVLKFSGALTLTHSAALVLPGAIDLSVSAGDCITVVNESTGVWRFVSGSNARAIGGTTAPVAGQVGELLTSTAGTGSLTSGVSGNATSITLTPGVWDVQASIGFDVVTGPCQSRTVSLSTTSATLGPNDGMFVNGTSASAGYADRICSPLKRYVVTTNTIVYAVARAVFSGGSVSIIDCYMNARRVA